MNSDDILLDQTAAAKILGTTTASMNTLRSLGKLTIPYLKFGNRIRFRKSDLMRWIDSQIINAPPDP